MSPLPADQQGRLFEVTHRHLAAAGYPAYEVSNFAAHESSRSPHNQKYWHHHPYLGLGPSAHSFDGTTRSLEGPARTHGVGLLSSKAAAHSFGVEGVLEQVSKPFTIDRDEIRFQFMDFADNRIGAQLLVNGEVVREVLGWSTESVSQVVWDVTDLKGAEAVFRIRDDAEPMGAWVGVDNIVFADRSEPSVAAR